MSTNNKDCVIFLSCAGPKTFGLAYAHAHRLFNALPSPFPTAEPFLEMIHNETKRKEFELTLKLLAAHAPNVRIVLYGHQDCLRCPDSDLAEKTKRIEMVQGIIAEIAKKILNGNQEISFYKFFIHDAGDDANVEELDGAYRQFQMKQIHFSFLEFADSASTTISSPMN